MNVVRSRTRQEKIPGIADELDRLTRQYRAIRATDFFNSPRAQDIEMQLQKIAQKRRSRGALPKINPHDCRRRTWLTRPRPEIDRVGSAWLIRKFIDPNARFVFASKASTDPDAVSFDMLDAEFSHIGDDCAFETLTKRFVVRDKAIFRSAIGEQRRDNHEHAIPSIRFNLVIRV
jgi:hypothetical protein